MRRFLSSSCTVGVGGAEDDLRLDMRDDKTSGGGGSLGGVRGDGEGVGVAATGGMYRSTRWK